VRRVFTGHIAGAGSSSGLRIVVGIWDESPFGAFTDVAADGRRRTRLVSYPTTA
jgi:hypothetical protein